MDASGGGQGVGHQQPQRPEGDEQHDRREEVAVGAGMVDGGLTEDHERYQRHAQQRHRQLGPPLDRAAGRVDASLGGPGAHSSSPRRIASATAAARSETPSFS